MEPEESQGTSCEVENNKRIEDRKNDGKGTEASTDEDKEIKDRIYKGSISTAETVAKV